MILRQNHHGLNHKLLALYEVKVLEDLTFCLVILFLAFADMLEHCVQSRPETESFQEKTG